MNFLSITWDPSLGIDLGFFIIRWYSLMFVAAFIIGLRLMKKIYIDENINLEKLDTLFMYTFIAMLVGMRFGEVFFYSWDYYKNNLLEIILPLKRAAGETAIFGLVEGWKFTGYTGFASHGAAIAIILSMYWYSRKHLNKSLLFILDRMSIVCALGAAFVRIGNFFNSEIYGKPTGSNFGVIFKNSDAEMLPRHPTQLYEALCYLILFFVLWRFYWKTDKKQKTGFLFGVFMIGLWSARFFIEFFKEAQVDGREDWILSLNTGQVLSIPLILIGLWLMLRKTKTS
ncbi:prolipoprotein diacylglyceryl transferase [Flavobacteriaceae bacterium]|jgi:prolipoprotein diacylglyceryl transferase|nr:prolipoprotein diacylglyceryl transferase [Flavobacteriaceae bacterium]MDC3285698.1 prolipoprotein diacylglyceryl transferase [Flavobacteriaceae bacterium]MDC3318324.1 prolipoprotein diacylglyceryl transferase [Flavobacteriaceae bacterium]